MIRKAEVGVLRCGGGYDLDSVDTFDVGDSDTDLL
jgi:hypothetical protein